MVCDSLAFTGRPGSANVHIVVDFICAPSGNFIVRGVIAGWAFDIGAADTKKRLVAPESSIAHSCTFFIFMFTIGRRTLAADPNFFAIFFAK